MEHKKESDVVAAKSSIISQEKPQDLQLGSKEPESLKKLKEIRAKKSREVYRKTSKQIALQKLASEMENNSLIISTYLQS